MESRKLSLYHDQAPTINQSRRALGQQADMISGADGGKDGGVSHVLRDSQPKARTTEASGSACVSLDKRLEQRFLNFFTDTNARILNNEDNLHHFIGFTSLPNT